MRPPRWVFAFSVAFGLAGCGVPVQSGALFTNGWEPGRLTSFKWHEEMEHASGDRRLEDNTFFHSRLREAVEWELNLRGIRYSESDATLLVHHHLSLADHELEREIVDDSGVLGLESVMYEGGTVVIHVEDVSAGEDVWLAWASANIEPALTSPDAMRRWVYRMVGNMFQDWDVPARTVSN